MFHVYMGHENLKRVTDVKVAFLKQEALLSQRGRATVRTFLSFSSTVQYLEHSLLLLVTVLWLQIYQSV